MDVLAQDKLILFILFIIPGFISLKIYELIHPSEKQESSKQIIEAITYSCINYAILLPLLLITVQSQSKGLKIFTYALAIFIAPIVWTILWSWLRKRPLFKKNMPHPIGKPWDFVFSKLEEHWVIIILEDGQKIAGKYGEKSFTSSSPHKEQIYLEETWVLDKNDVFKRPRNQSSGILVTSDNIASIELFKPKKEKQNE